MNRTLALAVLALGALPVLAQQAVQPQQAVQAQPADPAHRLVQAMAADETAAIGTQVGYRMLVEQGQSTPQEAQCMQRVDRTAFTDVFARTLAGELSAQEIEQALAFYESDVGKKFVQVQIVEAYAQFGENPPAAKPELTAAEQTAITAYLDTPVGTKLVANAVLTDSTLGRRAAREKLRELQARCVS